KKLAERQAAEGTGTSKHSLGMAPAGSSQPVETPVNLTGGIRGEIAYGNNVEANNFFSIDVDNPSAPTVIGATSYTAFCGDFEPGDVDNMYVIDYDTDVLKMVDIATGVATDVVSVPCPMAGSGGIWTDLAIDKNDGTFYATATDINFSNLYIIDPSSGVITLVGDIGVAAIISCTIDLDGVMYGFDIVSDNTYSIDVATGAATLLGPAGFDGNYAQGMGYDAVNDVVYLAAYAASAQLRTLNTSTGATTLIGALPGETGAFGFPYEGGTPATNDLSISSIVSPNTGVNLTNAEAVVIKIKNNGSAAQSNFPWTVTWNGPTGAGSANGTYTGSLAAGASVEVTAGTANLSTYGLYTFEACVNLAGDENPANNCKTKNVSNDEPSLCVDNLYSSGCSFGDGLIAWNLANIDVPNIPCSGTPPWYHDYRDMIHELPAGETYTLTIQAGYSSTYVDVWIDYNDDLLLTDNELVLNDAVCTDGNVPYTFQITIPETAPGGDHVLRFRTNWTAPVTDPCATYSYGNCCDFKA
ncbi:hypothetical protein EOM75_15315, partial [Candidatus Falkowbacteria bacterium]|nr:hypothetical protein [Candidatus Falkowbacteria bacterium]